MKVPFFRPSIGEAEIEEVVATLRSGWLTTGPKTREFEERFADATGARHALALSSCTAALHLSVEALGLRPGDGVLVPTMTFAATAEVVRYLDAVPILVDCDPITGHLDLDDAERKIESFERRELRPALQARRLVGLIAVHVGGVMLDLGDVREFTDRHDLWMIEDAAHAFPAAWRQDESSPWQRCGEGSSRAACFSFYANKTITTGEGGMVVTDDDDLYARMKMMALHGLSRDAWNRYSGGAWDYRIVAAGFKYNLTDVAAAIGLRQLDRAEELRHQREELAQRYLDRLSGIEELELPPDPSHRRHAWHLFPIRLRLDRLQVDRDEFVDELAGRGIGFSVHWRPLHLHPYYKQLGWEASSFPSATDQWQRLVSLPLFPGMSQGEQSHVVTTIEELCRRHRRHRGQRASRATA